MKKSISLLLAIIMLFSVVSVGVSAASTSDLTFELNRDGKSYSVIECNESAKGVLSIPATYNNKPVTTIRSGAFSYCSEITTISISSNLKTIEDSALSPLEGLVSVSVDSNNPYFSSKDGVLFNKNQSVLIKYPAQKNLKKYVVPSSVKTIREYAFELTRNLTDVVLPYGLTSIGEGAFTSSFINSITIPDSVTFIDRYVFSNCCLLYAKFGKGITEINYDMFYCGSVQALCLGAGIKRIREGAFYGHVDAVYFEGTEKQWASVVIEEFDNDELKGINIHCNYKPSVLVTPRVSVTNEIDYARVDWDCVPDAVRYVVFRRAAGSSVWEKIYESEVGETYEGQAWIDDIYLDHDIQNNTYYLYSVRAYNSKGEQSAYNRSEACLFKCVETPRIYSVYNHLSGIATKWNAVPGATSYRVYRLGAGDEYWTYLGATKNLYYIDYKSKNDSGKYYKYTVKAVNGYMSAYYTGAPAIKRLANPTLTSAVSSSSGITVKWGAVKGTTGYYVYRKTANSTWVRVATVGGTNNTTFLDKTAKKGTTYTYTVKAVYGATTSGYYSGISCYDKY